MVDDTLLESEFTPAGYVPFYVNRDLAFYEEGTYVEETRGGVLLLVKSLLNPTPAYHRLKLNYYYYYFIIEKQYKKAISQ